MELEKTTASRPKRVSFLKRQQLKKDLDHITEEMYRRNKELADTNKLLSILQAIESLALESQSTTTNLAIAIAETLAQMLEYSFVGIFTKDNHLKDAFSLSGWSGLTWVGKEKNLKVSTQISFDSNTPWINGDTNAASLNLEMLDETVISSFLHLEPKDIHKIRDTLQLKRLYIIKLISRGHVVGLLVLGFQDTTSLLDKSETDRLQRISESIGLAIDNKMLFSENKRVLRALKESNTKLLALDEAKDDFISMASHQLRTPLTSIKGYISMILDGDVGKISPTQRKMLEQSFFSSQRMVYMISDLLNVSRIRTGKFAIESSEVKLDKMIKEELDQLKEMSKTHELNISYVPPKDFPVLMLDETKIRQVIMNFVDNAIYYTPAKGKIEVILKNDEKTIELLVKDSGIGVPKKEQPSLFTKFYRAENARKVRPDGTGLGLFMAKKVIISQGGSIVFDSVEGKGSTFGFLFTKKKELLPSSDVKTTPTK